MSEVVPMPGKALSSKQQTLPNPELVTKLKELLEDAERGRLQSMSYAKLSNDGGLGYGWITATKDDACLLIGQTHVMLVDLAGGMIDD